MSGERQENHCDIEPQDMAGILGRNVYGDIESEPKPSSFQDRGLFLPDAHC